MTTTTQIHVWWSAGGGVGKTTMAIMQAAALARQFPGQVALVDFKEATPHIHRYLGLEPKNLMPLFDAIEKKTLSFALLQSFMQVKHGILVLTGVGLKEFTAFTEKHFETILNILKTGFKHIVVDVNGGIFFSSTFAAVSLADFINVVNLPQMACLQDTKEITDFLQSNWGVATEKFTYYLNKVAWSTVDMSHSEFESILGKKTIKIPKTKEIASITVGRSPLVPEAELLLPVECLNGKMKQSKRRLKLLSFGRSVYADKSL